MPTHSTFANDTLYGLGAGVWTRDTHRAYRMARAIKAGLKASTYYVTHGGGRFGEGDYELYNEGNPGGGASCGGIGSRAATIAQRPGMDGARADRGLSA